MQGQETGNGAPGALSSMAGGLRGDAPAQGGDTMRPEEGPRSVEGPSPASSAARHHRASQATDPRPTQAQAAAKVAFETGSWGHNHRLSAKEVDRAILEYVLRKAEQEGKALPCGGDLIRFHERAQVIHFDGERRPVSPVVTMIAWEER